ncbi:toxin [Variovorax sp. KK3]|uniref:toxin n=2 Tax=Variovorax sp. KK3 TaxID=1855728 RepID=UPI00097C8D84
MKSFRWGPEKNEVLRADRGISFESIVVAIESGGLLDVLAHPNRSRYPRQRVLVVAWDGYAYLVPFVEEEEYFFLKTVIPSRKATRDYLGSGELDDEHG